MIVIRVGWVRRRTGRTTSTTRQTATNSASYSFSLEGKVSSKCKKLIFLSRKWKNLKHRVEIVVVHDLESESIFLNPPKLRSDSLSFRAAQTITFHCKNTVAFRNPRVRTSPIFLKTSSTIFFLLLIKLYFSHFWNSTPGKYEKRSFLDELERPWDQEGGQL